MENNNQECCNHMQLPLIGEDAPKFTAVTTNGVMNFPDDYKGKWVVFFSHPADFTPVCTTEFMTFARMENEFKELNVELVGLSVDGLHAHIEWMKSMKDIYVVLRAVKIEAYDSLRSAFSRSAIAFAKVLHSVSTAGFIACFTTQIGRAS